MAPSVNCMFVLFSQQFNTTRNSSGDEIAKCDLMILACLTTPFLFNPLGGVIPLDDLRDFWWVLGWPGYNMVQKYPRKVKPPECTHVTDDRQTDGFACH